MSRQQDGSLLPRGGGEIPVGRNPESFTCVVRRPAELEQLRGDPEIGPVERLTRSVVRASVVSADDVEALRDATMHRLRSDGGLVVHHEYLRAGDPATAYRLTDEIIVRFGDDAAPTRIATRADEAGVVLKKAYPELGNTYLVRVTDRAAANPLRVARRLAAARETLYAEPVLVNSFAPAALPVDDRFPSQWHLYGTSPAGPDIVRDAGVSVVEAWDLTKGSRDVVVAVLDDGFDLDHPDFNGPGKVRHAVDFVGDDRNPVPEEGDYHGTPCAGIAVAEENGYGCVGVAPGCTLMPVRFPFDAHDSWLIEIFQYVSRRAHVASCSWSRTPGHHPLNRALEETLTRLAASGGADGRGLVIVFAAGNYDAPISGRCDAPVRWRELSASGRPRIRSQLGELLNGLPAHPAVIAVSACTSLNQKALYSNWGEQIAVAAPSNNRDPTDPSSPLPGRGITTTDNEPPYGTGFSPGKRYTDSFGGTSAACPLVAGVAALVKSANPLLGAAEIKQIIQATATKIEDRSGDPLYPGNAFGTYDSRGHSPWFGFGKVDAAAAVRAAARRARGRIVVERTAPGFAIPGLLRGGAAGVIPIHEAGWVVDAEVAVELGADDAGDLQVTIAAPGGAEAVLRSAGEAGRARYTFSDTPVLGALLGHPAQGDWVLRVATETTGPAQAVERWGLRLTLAVAAVAQAGSPGAGRPTTPAQ